MVVARGWQLVRYPSLSSSQAPLETILGSLPVVGSWYGARFRQKFALDDAIEVPTHAHLKRCHVCAQCHSSRVGIAPRRSHRKFRPNAEGTRITLI